MRFLVGLGICAALASALLPASAAAAAAPVAEEAPNVGSVEVTVSWPPELQLPVGAALLVSIEDTAKTGAPSVQLAQQTIKNPARPPLRVEVPINDSRLDPRARYVARARILVDGRLHLQSDRVHPVLRSAEDRRVTVEMRPTGASGQRALPVPDAPLVGTYWRLLRIDKAAVPAMPDHREPSLLLKNGNGNLRWQGTVGCNRLMGGFESLGHSIRFSNAAAATRMACPPALEERESLLLSTLANVTAWRIKGDQLDLLDETGRPTIVAEAVYLR